MAIDEEMRATIARLSRAEGWPVGTIARHLGIHHSTVTRALGARGQERRARPKMIDPFIPFIVEKLEENADLPASTLYGQVEERGYRGGEDHFRHTLRLSMVHCRLAVCVIPHGPVMFDEERQNQVSFP